MCSIRPPGPCCNYGGCQWHLQKRNKESALSALTCTNVVVLHIPTRYDLMKESIVNKEVKKANMDINKVCRSFRNVKVQDISNISRAWHTRHGQHLNKIGKEHISEEISKIIGKTEKNHLKVIALSDSNQGN
jgi:hypothetical protein